MRLGDWLDSGDLQQQPATREEIARLLLIADRDLADATVGGISRDRQFAICYEAALTLALAVLRAAGYRPRGTSPGHHWLAFALLPELMGPEQEARSRYYQACRRKRHQASYDRSGVASEVEVQELRREVQDFRAGVLAWLPTQHPELSAGSAEVSEETDFGRGAVGTRPEGGG